jgi:hypothetical protein
MRPGVFPGLPSTLANWKRKRLFQGFIRSVRIMDGRCAVSHVPKFRAMIARYKKLMRSRRAPDKRLIQNANGKKRGRAPVPKLLRGYALDAIDAPPSAPVSSAETAGFIARIGGTTPITQPGVGLGKDVRLSGEGVSGAAFWAEERHIHVCAFNAAVVTYKVDRLSRSLLDFARPMETFDKHGVRFVAVTQQLDTRSLGRLSLNVLLSFAQFEREIIAERTRDKISAAHRKGKWTGGYPVLGYDVAPGGGRLVVKRGRGGARPGHFRPVPRAPMREYSAWQATACHWSAPLIG